MIKTVVKLAFVALLANATWHVFVVYLAHYRFKDSVTSTAQFGVEKTDSQLRERILELAERVAVHVRNVSIAAIFQSHVPLDRPVFSCE